MHRVQLIALIKPDTAARWSERLSEEAQAGQYSATDVVYMGNERDLLKQFGGLLHKNGVFLHSCKDESRQSLNYLIREDCNYYTVYSDADNFPHEIPRSIDRYVDGGKFVMLVKPTEGRNGLLCNTTLSTYLCHDGFQSIDEKIDIYCANQDCSSYVFSSIDAFLAEANKNG